MDTSLTIAEPIGKPATRRIPCPEPGVYRGIPAADYHAWDACNKSSLDVLHEYSPMHYEYRLRNPKPGTPDMLVGSGIHALTLEGEEAYRAEFVTGGPINEKTGKSYGHDTAKFAEWMQAVGPGKSFVTTDQDAKIRACSAAILKRQAARVFLEAPGENELSIVWVDAATGILCKGRIDAARPTWGSIGDLKSTQNASKEEFQRSIETYGYDRQAAWYLDGARAVYELTGDPILKDIAAFAFICIEKEPPYGVATYCMRDASESPSWATLQVARDENARLLRIVRNCRETDTWPGYDNDFEDITTTEWALRRAMRF